MRLSLNKISKDLLTQIIAQTTAVVAVMGPTGSGKSTFINKACQTEEMVVGKGLESCTAVVASSKQFQLNGRTVVLIDTPGFDDTNRSDAEILGDISVYLTAAYEYGVRLTGVLYLHRISDNRVSGLTRRNMKMFQKMCGPEAMNNVIIVTNMWGGVDGSVGQLRETELQSNNAFLAEAMKKGAQMRRHDDTHRSACDIISELLKNDPVTLKIQTEIVYENKNLLDTEAGKALNLEYTEQIKSNRREIEALKEDLENTHAHEIETIAEIRRELEQVRKDKENAENEKLALNASNERLKKAAAEQGAGT